MTSDRCARQPRRGNWHDRSARRTAAAASNVPANAAGASAAIEVSVRPTGALIGLGGSLELSLEPGGGCSFSGSLTPSGIAGRGSATVNVVVKLPAAYAPPVISLKPEPGNRWFWDGEAGLDQDQTLHFVMDEIHEVSDVIGQVVEAMAPVLASVVTALYRPDACHQAGCN